MPNHSYKGDLDAAMVALTGIVGAAIGAAALAGVMLPLLLGSD